MVFLRPTIIRDDLAMNAISGQKYELMRAYQLDKQAQGISLMPGFDTPILPEQPTAHQLLEELKRQSDAKTDKAPANKAAGKDSFKVSSLSSRFRGER